MPIVWDNDNIWIAKTEIFYTTANAAQMRGGMFLTQKGLKYMGYYWLNGNDLKEFCSMLQNFQLQQFHSWMKVDNNTLSYKNEIIFFPYAYYGSFGQIGWPVAGFNCNSRATKKIRIIEFL